MRFCAKAHRQFSELKGTDEAEPDRYGPPVVAVQFPVGDDIGRGTDGGHLIKAVEDEVLQVRQVDIVAVAVTREVPILLNQTADFPLRPHINAQSGRPRQPLSGAQNILGRRRETQVEAETPEQIGAAF